MEIFLNLFVQNLRYLFILFSWKITCFLNISIPFFRFQRFPVSPRNLNVADKAPSTFLVDISVSAHKLQATCPTTLLSGCLVFLQLLQHQLLGLALFQVLWCKPWSEFYIVWLLFILVYPLSISLYSTILPIVLFHLLVYNILCSLRRSIIICCLLSQNKNVGFFKTQR